MSCPDFGCYFPGQPRVGRIFVACPPESPLILGMIHPTAVIDPKAELDSDVKVGPYAVIEGSVRIGSGTEIQGHAVISGYTRVGKNNRVGYGAIIGSFPQDLSFNPKVSSGVEIGDNNVIREYCTVHRGTKEGSNTFVGSNNLFMVGAHLGHNTRVADHVILANNVLLGGYVEIHDRVFIGGGSVVHQFTRMGAVSLLQGISGIGKDIPPFSIAIGKNSVAALNVIGLRRAGFSQALRSEVKNAFELLYRSGLNAKQALEEAEKRTWAPETMIFWNFVATAKRGICPMARWKDVRSEEE
jgi:UDP-N-acetylglucosamine acyltransferase